MNRTLGILAIAGALILGASATLLVARYHRVQAAIAAIQAAELKGQRDALIVVGKEREKESVVLRAESKVLRTQGETQAKAARAKDVEIGQLKGTVATLKAHSSAPATPIEHALDNVVAAQDVKIGHLEGALTSTTGALDACTGALNATSESSAAYQKALASEIARSSALETVIRHTPKARPRSLDLIYGKDATGKNQYGIAGAYAFGPIRVGAVAVNHFAGVSLGYSW